MPVANFILHLKNTPRKFGGRREVTTLNNVYSHIKILIDFCFDLGVSFDCISYQVHILQLRQALISRGVSSISYNIYYKSWRTFYDWCTATGIHHCVRFPAKIEFSQSSYSSEKRLGLRRSSNLTVGLDPGLESVEDVSDYADRVLNDGEFKTLFEALKNDDPVYAYIAYMMVTVGLRIGGVLQIPLGANKLNPRWLRYPELSQRQLKFQRLSYLPKGRKKVMKCMVLTSALAVLHREYILPIRKLLTVLPRSNKRVADQSVLWVNKHGKQVKDYDVWAAFRRASNIVGRRVTPHFLRHTYATYVVYYYFKEKNIKPSLAYAHDIHEQLRIQLGHSSLETTKLYISTIIRVEMEAWLPFLTPHAKRDIEAHIPSQVLADVIEFFEPSFAKNVEP